jgi:hypothetical protein
VTKLPEHATALHVPWFTQDNHIKFGWGTGEFNFDQQDKPFWFSFDPYPSDYVSDNYFLECQKAALSIHARACELGLPILLFMSGGLDSELAARTFLSLNIPFEVCVVRYEQNMNAHDNVYAFEFCRKHNICVHTWDVFLSEWLIDAYHTKYVTTLFYNIQQMKMLEHAAALGFFGVIGSGEQYIRRPPGASRGIEAPFGSKNTAPFHWQADHPQYHGVAAFFLYTPSLLRSFYVQPETMAVRAGHQECDWLGYKVKESIYLRHVPEIKKREKFNGIENFVMQRFWVENFLRSNHNWRLAKEYFDPYEVLF